MPQKLFKKIISILPQIIASLFLIGLIITVFGFQKGNEIKAGASDNVSGWAWSENIGWISFNNTSGGGAISYGVKIDPQNGKLSGYAWSDNIGWISFNETDTGAPPSNDPCADTSCLAKATPSGQLGVTNVNIYGWARALANGGGWDGWIRFDHGQTNPVYIDSIGNIDGWAWGSDVVGWIDFYNVVLDLSGFNQPPDPPTNTNESWNHCSVQGVSKITLSWSYFDTDGDPQDAYQILVDNNSNFSSPEIDSCVSPEPNTCSAGNSSQNYTPITNLNFSATTYYWKIKVKDSQGNWSNWSSRDNFTTPLHAYPWPAFTFSPSNPSQGEAISFQDQTTFYNGEDSWLWDFGDSQASSEQNPSHAYSSTGNFCVRLTATDSATYSCQSSACPPNSTINIGLPLPEWKEISPF